MQRRRGISPSRGRGPQCQISLETQRLPRATTKNIRTTPRGSAPLTLTTIARQLHPTPTLVSHTVKVKPILRTLTNKTRKIIATDCSQFACPLFWVAASCSHASWAAARSTSAVNTDTITTRLRRTAEAKNAASDSTFSNVENALVNQLRSSFQVTLIIAVFSA